MSVKRTLSAPAWLLALSLFVVPLAARAQNDAPQTEAQTAGLPPGSLSIVVPCNGGNTLLGIGGAVGIKVTFVVNLPSSGCTAVLDCPDIAGDPAFVAPRGTGPAVFGCGTGRLRLTGGNGGGTARLYIGGAD